MQSVTSRWEPSLRGGSALATVKTRAEVYNSSGTLIASTEMRVGSIPALLLDGGEVSVDVTSEILRRASAVFLDDGSGVVVPGLPTDLLSNVSGNEIKLYRGLTFQALPPPIFTATNWGDGGWGNTIWGGVSPQTVASDELKSLGVFGFGEDETADADASLKVTVQLYDRSRRIRRAKFTRPYKISKDTNYVTAIRDLLQSRWSGITISSASTAFTTPFLLYDAADDPWARAKEMAKSIGFDVFFDVDGVCQLQPVPSSLASAPPTFKYEEGVDATIVDVTRRSSNEGRFSGVILTGASSSNVSPPVAEVWDIDPSSSTYSGYDPVTKTFGASAFGAVPLFESNPLLTTRAQCEAAAAARLLEVTGKTEAIEFSAFVNPAHDPRDVVSVRRDRAKINARYELEAFTIPLRADGLMRARTKERRAQ